MQQNTEENRRYIEEDEIDLKELFITIWKRKFFILIFTFIVTALAIVYAYIKTPIYEATSIVEIGSYKSGDNKTLLDETLKLSQELSILYIDILKNEKNRDAWIENISVLKGQKNFLEIKAQGLNNEVAIKELKKVVKYIKSKHLKIISEVLDVKKQQLNNIDRRIKQLKENNLVVAEEKIEYLKTNTLVSLDEKIEYLKTNTLVSLEEDIEYLKTNTLVSLNEDIKYAREILAPSYDKKIKTTNKKIELLTQQLKDTNKNIIKTKNSDASLAALNVMEKRNLETSISNLKLSLIDLDDKKENLITKTIPRLKREKEKLLNIKLKRLKREKDELINVKFTRLKREKDELLNVKLPALIRAKDKLLNIDLNQLLESKLILETSILAHNYKNTQIVGNIMTNDYQVKPKKKLIVVVGFVTAFILSIFLVFFMEFINGFKKDENQTLK